ncbi:agmatinase [Actinomadura cremea]|nr:agmatinase [Actinomadura cremea]
MSEPTEPTEPTDRHELIAGLQGERAKRFEREITDERHREELRRAHRLGLPPADSIVDREQASTFQRGELPHFSGIATFLKAPYLEDVTRVGEHEVAVVGAPLDTGTTYRPGPRFGPQGMRHISALYTPYYYEMGVDLREQLSMVDVGDIFVTPANIEKAFDQITKGVEHLVGAGAFPVILGGDHSIGFPTARGVMNAFGRKIGVIHFDRHLDTQRRDLDERMHTTPYYWAAHELHFDMGNLVQIGIGGWQVPRAGVAEARDGGSVVITAEDVERLGVDRVADLALEVAWGGGAEGVFLSFDIDAVDPGFAPGTGWPEPGGLYPREVLRLVRRFAAEGLLGMEVVEVSPPYDVSDVTSLLGVRLVCEVLAASVGAGRLGRARDGRPHAGGRARDGRPDPGPADAR